MATMRTPAQKTDFTPLARTRVTYPDVHDPASMRAAVAASLARYGRIDALVNNAVSNSATAGGI